MPHFDRRTLLNASLKGLALSGAATLAPRALTSAALAQGASQPGLIQPPATHFGMDDVIRRAHDLASAPYDPTPPKLPDALTKMDFDSYRDLRFKADKSPLGPATGPFRLQLFHPGFIYNRPVVVNTIRDGIATPVPYAANLFDYGRNKFDHALPVNLGFAGFRLHYPLNSPHGSDELVSFLGASYFRFLGRGQTYGLSARGLSVNTGGDDEEFPHLPRILDRSVQGHAGKGDDLCAARRRLGHRRLSLRSLSRRRKRHGGPGDILPRRDNVKFGMAPLTSMYFFGEDRGKFSDDYRGELHDSDGLLMHPAREMAVAAAARAEVVTMSTLAIRRLKGFGLVQRDRNFDQPGSGAP